MGKDFLPRSDSGLKNWSMAFCNALLTRGSEVSVSPEWAERYALLHAEYSEALSTANTPNTRVRSNILIKDRVRARLKQEARQLSRYIQGQPQTTDTLRSVFQLSIRSSGTSIEAATEPPLVIVRAANGWRVDLKLRESGSTTGGKAARMAGAAIIWHVGDEPPSHAKDWRVLTETSRTRFKVDLPTSLPAGTRIWLAARWKTPRFEDGPGSPPVGILVGGGIPQVAG